MEVSSKKLDLNAYVNGTKPTKNREKCHSIWIGVLYADLRIDKGSSEKKKIRTDPHIAS